MKVSIRNLNVKYMPKSKFEVNALKNVYMEINSYNFYTIVGNSGSGKTTLVKSLSALRIGKDINIFFNGKPLSKKYKHNKDLLKYKSDLATTFQFPDHQIFSKSVEDELKLIEKYKKIKINRDEFSSILSDLGFKNFDLFSLCPLIMSDGEKRKLVIALSIISNAKIIILDEPTTGLDPVSEKRVLEILLKQKEMGKAVIMITHNIRNAYSYSDYVFVLNKGIIAKHGSPEILRDKEFMKSVNLYSPYEIIGSLKRSET
ncbi:MAG: ATP-binding cassette domain-containing protein [Mycoplasmataceae bacterium]|nr:ATP-binding cassette domain-containing protein [Mycoplasmataceae bacterium]